MAYTDRKEVSGKLIHELKELESELTSEAIFPISQNSLTRKVTLKNIKLALSKDDGDIHYYTAEQIDAIIQEIFDKLDDFYNEIKNIGREVDALRDDINDIRSFVVERINYLDNKIDQINEDLTNAIIELRRFTVEKLTELNNKLDAYMEKTNKLIQDIYNKLADLYSYGTDIPTELREGKFYFQYFEDSLASPILNYHTMKQYTSNSSGFEKLEGCPISLDISGSTVKRTAFHIRLECGFSGSVDGVTLQPSTTDMYDISIHTKEDCGDDSKIYSVTGKSYDTQPNEIILQNVPIPENTDLLYAKIVYKNSSGSTLFRWEAKSSDIVAITEYGFFIRSN